MKRILTLAALLLTIAFTSAAAHADPIPVSPTYDFTVTLDQPVQYVQYSDSYVAFYAYITADANNPTDIFLQGDTYTLTSPDFSFDDSGLLFFFPYEFTPGMSDHDLLFAFYFPNYEPLGQYVGSFTVIAGSDSSSEDLSQTVNFEIDVVPNVNNITPTSSTPEPSSLFLLGTGLFATFGAIKRNQSSKL